MRVLLLGIVTLLAACPLQGTHSSTLGGGSSGVDPSSNNPDATVTVPKVTGMTKDDANAALASAGFTHGVDEYPMTCDGAKAPGTIECQDPDPGASVKASSMIKVSVLEAREHTRFTDEDFASLKGLTIADATARAKKLCHTGKVNVLESGKFIEGCKAGTVCKAIDGRSIGGGMAFDQDMTLYTNKTLSIAPPPD
ncbi:hypothetical protein BH11MYX2_BH11MYX2_04200 [soil metagenome]